MGKYGHQAHYFWPSFLLTEFRFALMFPFKMQDMIRYRHEPTCGLLDNLVWAAGGLIGAQESSEYFSLETLTWTEGPSITFESGDGKFETPGKIVTWGKRSYWIVNQNIWELVNTGESSSW